mgnify:CR=1 FL=1
MPDSKIIRTKLKKSQEKKSLDSLDLVSSQWNSDVEFRLARKTVINLWKNGKVDEKIICDAQSMLRRNASQCGVSKGESCPICEDGEIFYVTYVFGPRLPSHGRCISTKGELKRLNSRKAQMSAYMVEVCPSCGWNHLVSITSLGGN